MPVPGGTPDQGAGTPAAPPVLMPGMRWRQVFPGEERQLGVLRRWLASLLPDCPARDDVASVATELGSNTIRHTASGRGGWFAVEITWHQSAVRVAVADCGAPDGPRVIDDPAGEHGRGLLVVRGLSIRTGVCGDHRGRLMWADVPWGDAGAAKPASPQDWYEAAIRDGTAGLASRFAGVPAWFGRSTLQWWALAGGELVVAPSAPELASLLSHAQDQRPQWPPGAGHLSRAGAGTALAASRERLSEAPVRFPRARAPLPQTGRDRTGTGWHIGPRTVPGADAAAGRAAARRGRAARLA